MSELENDIATLRSAVIYSNHMVLIEVIDRVEKLARLGAAVADGSIYRNTLPFLPVSRILNLFANYAITSSKAVELLRNLVAGKDAEVSKQIDTLVGSAEEYESNRRDEMEDILKTFAKDEHPRDLDAVLDAIDTAYKA